VRRLRRRRGGKEHQADKRQQGRLKVGIDIPAPEEVRAIIPNLVSRGQILTECYAQGGDALTSTQWGAYAQGVFNVWGPFFLVGRYEHYDQPSPNPTLNILTGGAVWKPFPFMAVKADYRYVDRTSEDPSGFFLSFTSFF
jgi:hypothetical protein